MNILKFPKNQRARKFESIVRLSAQSFIEKWYQILRNILKRAIMSSILSQKAVANYIIWTASFPDFVNNFEYLEARPPLLLLA